MVNFKDERGLVTDNLPAAFFDSLRGVILIMPLTFAPVGKEDTVCGIRGKDEICRHLENLGFVVGGTVTVVSETGGNLIVSVKDTRIALSKGMASRIMIQ